MEVSCPKCKTTYDFEDTLIGPKGTVVRCTQCGYMFKIFRAEDMGVIQTAGWMIRKKNGSVFNVDRFSTLQKWILDGKVTPADELSRTGKTWKNLGDIVELSGLFKTTGGSGAHKQPQQEHGQPGSLPQDRRLEPRPSVTPVHEESWQDMQEGRATQPYKEPSPVFQSQEEGTVKGPLARSMETDEMEMEEGESILKPIVAPARGRKTAIIIIFLIIASPLAYVGIFHRDAVLEWMGKLKEPKTSEAGIDDGLKRARELVLADTSLKLDEAEKLYNALLTKQPRSVDLQVGLSGIQAARAQSLKNRLDHQQAAPLSPGEQEKLRSEITPLAEKARQYADEAVRIQADHYAAQRALANALRLGGELEAAAKAINKALDAKPNDGQSIYIETLIDYEQDKDIDGAIAGFKRALRKNEKLVAARFHLALMLALSGKKDDAMMELEEILAAQKNHMPSTVLADALQKGLILAAGQAADAATDPDVQAADVDAQPPPAATGAVTAKKEKEQEEEKEEKSASPASAPSGKSFEYYYKQGQKLQSAGNCAKAIEYYVSALDVNPIKAEAWTALAQCYIDTGRNGDAVNAFRKALNNNSRYGPAIIGLAEIYKRQKKIKLALEHYEKYLEVLPGGSQASLAKRNVEELKDLLQSTGGGDAGATPEPIPVSPPPSPPPTSGSGGTGESEVKSSIGQPTSDTPKTDGDPYD
ncbi:MAG: tetratricopeptide repeat protein [Pseudomonadota bacterium]